MSLSEYRTHALEAHSARQRNARPVPKCARGRPYYTLLPYPRAPCPCIVPTVLILRVP